MTCGEVEKDSSGSETSISRAAGQLDRRRLIDLFQFSWVEKFINVEQDHQTSVNSGETRDVMGAIPGDCLRRGLDILFWNANDL